MRYGWVVVIAALVGCGDSGKGDASQVTLATPHDGLQFLNFHVALGAGLFEDEGLDVTIFEPASPRRVDDALFEGDADAVVLPPPRFIMSIAADREPMVLFANLLENDSLNVVMRESVRESIGISPTDPLADRVNALSGLDIGVAPGAVVRLDALLSTQGLDIDEDVNMMRIAGEQQSPQFGKGEVDVLFAHTPYLEQAMIEHNGTLLIDVSGGEVEELAGLQRHGFVTTRQFADENPMVVTAITRAIYRAQQLLHNDLEAATEAVNAVRPDLDPELRDTIMPIMGPAMPETPEVSVEGIEGAVALFPSHREQPDLSGVDLEEYVRPEFAEQVVNE